MARKTRRTRPGSQRLSGVRPSVASAQKGIFRKDGAFWTVGVGGKVFQLKDSKALAYLAHMLRYPAAEFHVLDLVAGIADRGGEDDTDRQTRSGDDLEKSGAHIGLGDAGELLDDQAKRAYRRRLSELREELEQAKALGQVDRAEQLEDEIDALNKELARAVGLGGRNRRAASASERARQTVTKTLKALVERIAHSDPALGESLSRSIKTGNFCSYRPDPNFPIAWEFAASVIELQQPGLQAESAAVQAGPSQSTRSFLPIALFPLAERTPFVGRETERSAICRIVDRALNGYGSLFMIGGGAGVGKSRMAMEMAEYASQAGFRCFIGHCYERDERVPYLPFVEIIENSLAEAPSLEIYRRQIGDNATELAQLAPNLRRIFPDIPPPMELPAAMMRRYLFQSLAEMLGRLAQNRPLLIVVEDLHWADESTLALLIHLANCIAQLPMAVIGTYRDGFSEDAPALVRTLEESIRLGIRPLKLGGLSRGDVAQMLHRLSGRQVPESLVSLIFEESQGNPFFIEEVYRHLMEEGKIFDAAGDFQTDISIDEIDVPENVRLITNRRLERLNGDQKRVLEAASVIGRSFSFRLLSDVSHTHVDELFGVLEKAQQMGIVVPSAQGPETPFTFVHELVRQTLLAGISPPRRQQLHSIVAQAIERLHAAGLNGSAGEIADHLLKAGPFAERHKLVLCLTQAGKAALEAAAYEEARLSLRSALSHMDAADLKARADLLSSLAVAQRGLGDWDDALRMCNESVEIYRQLGDVEMTTDCIREGIAGLLMTRRYQEAAEMARRRLAELGDEPTESRADFLALLGLSYAMLGSYVPAKDALNEATALARRLSNPKLLVRVLANLCMLNTIFLEIADSLINTQTTLDLAQSDDFLWIRAGALYGQTQALYCLGRIEEARRISFELESVARKIGQLVLVAACIWSKAWAEFGKTPDLMRLEAQLDESLEICRTARIPENLAQSLAQVSLVKFLRGQQSSALDCALEASKLELQGPGYVQGFAVGTVFRERAYAGDHAGAMAVFNENLSKLPRADQPNAFGSWAFLVSVVEGLAMLGERDQAADFYPLVCRLVDTGIISLPVMARFSRTIAGVAATAAQQWQSAEGHFSIALRQAEEIPDQLERAECRRFYGSMLLDRNSAGDREQARRLLTDALGDYTRIGMPLHIELTEALLAKV